MEQNKVLQERLDVMHACVKHEHTYRVPHFSNFWTWKILDSDLHPKLSEALADYGMLDRMQCEFQERYGFDTHYDLLSRNLLKPSSIMGGHHHLINDETESINFFDHVLMEDTEYSEYGTDRWAVSWRMFLRKYPDLDQGTMAKAIAMNIENSSYLSHMQKKMATLYGCPNCYGPTLQVPHERFHKYYRGIKAATMDMRRHKGEMLKTYDMIMEDEIMPAVNRALAMDTSDCVCDVMEPFLAHTMMNQKQWDEFYWPYMKQILDAVQAAGKSIMIFVENSIIRFKDYFQDYPKGCLVLVPELDDVVELRKAIPNAAVIGGISSVLLGRGTPEECVDATKRVIDAMGDGFILGANKMISFRNDCRRENLLAVCEYVQNFRW
ncbi:MAG: hypothetical protein LUE24_04955 [Lachnospiraceae bacterium]|nr:hypothetical protein [Lachnospiraceae bacterium]